MKQVLSTRGVRSYLARIMEFISSTFKKILKISRLKIITLLKPCLAWFLSHFNVRHGQMEGEGGAIPTEPYSDMSDIADKSTEPQDYNNTGPNESKETGSERFPISNLDCKTVVKAELECVKAVSFAPSMEQSFNTDIIGPVVLPAIIENDIEPTLLTDVKALNDKRKITPAVNKATGPQGQEPRPEEGIKVKKTRHILPEKHGGRPHGSSENHRKRNSNKNGSILRKRLLHKPEIVCLREGMGWTVGIEMSDELDSIEVELHQVIPLEPSLDRPGFWPLPDPLGKVVVEWREIENNELKSVEFPCKQFRVFKLSGLQQDRGREVACISRGRYMVIVPETWLRDEKISGTESISPETVHSKHRHKAHFFEVNGNDRNSVVFLSGNKRKIFVPSKKLEFSLDGDKIVDAYQSIGPLFRGDPPYLQNGRTSYKTVVVGEEVPSNGGRRWRKSAARFEDVRKEIASRQAGWFFVRLYDDNDRLIESQDFRYCRDLKNIDTQVPSTVPAPDGHGQAMILVRHDRPLSVQCQWPDSCFKMEATDDVTYITVPTDPRADISHWTLAAFSGCKVDFSVRLERIWWDVALEGEKPHWRDRKIELTDDLFLPTSRHVLYIRLPRQGWAEKILLGFRSGYMYGKRVSPRDESCEIPLRNLGGFLPTDSESEAVLHMYIESQGGIQDGLKSEIASVKILKIATIANWTHHVFCLRPPRLMTLLTRACRRLPKIRRPVCEFRNQYYRKWKRGKLPASEFFREGLCLLAAIIDKQAAKQPQGQALGRRRWQHRAQKARKEWPETFCRWRSKVKSCG